MPAAPERDSLRRDRGDRALSPHRPSTEPPPGSGSIAPRGPGRGRAAVAVAVVGLALAVVGAVLAAPPARTATPQLAPGFPGGPYFALGCGLSHRNNDDAILFPGSPGRSHNHTYIGNRRTDATTTPASLLGGSTTCEDPADSSTYWVPTLYEANRHVNPLTGIVYYVRRTRDRVAPMPAGLKIVAGNQSAKKRQSKNIVAWSCGGVGGKPRFHAIRQCEDDQLLQLQVNFPSCWNGRDLDSPNHRSHMKYSVKGRCPASHPVAVPTIALILLYPPTSRFARVVSGKFGAHADFVNGWDQQAFATLVAGLN
jgi:hypothetical protein